MHTHTYSHIHARVARPARSNGKAQRTREKENEYPCNRKSGMRCVRGDRNQHRYDRADQWLAISAKSLCTYPFAGRFSTLNPASIMRFYFLD